MNSERALAQIVKRSERPQCAIKQEDKCIGVSTLRNGGVIDP